MVHNLGPPAPPVLHGQPRFLTALPPDANVVRRPTAAGGKGWALTGHHEIMVPLLAALLTEASRPGNEQSHPVARCRTAIGDSRRLYHPAHPSLGRRVPQVFHPAGEHQWRAADGRQIQAADLDGDGVYDRFSQAVTFSCALLPARPIAVC